MLLDPTQREQIIRLTAERSAALCRRATVLLGYDDGLTTREVARRAGLSPGRARYWRREFLRRGMEVFPVPEILGELACQTLPEEQLLTDESLSAAGETPPVKRKHHRHTVGKARQDDLLDLPFPQPRESPGVQPDDSLAEAGRKVMLFQFAEMLRHEEGTRLGADIEDLHKMRVATRRLRAAFDVFAQAYKPKVVKTHLKGLRLTGRLLGRVRDLDVFLEKANRYLADLPPEAGEGLAPLLDAWREERQAARQAMLSHLDSMDYLAFKRSFNLFLQTPGAGVAAFGGKEDDVIPSPRLVREVAPILIYTRLANVRAFDTILPNASLDQLHALRIEFKKLRYTLEYFHEVLGSEAGEVIGEIRRIQDHLGDLNDARVACQLLTAFLENWERQQMALPLNERQNPEAIVAYLAYQHAERHRLLTTFLQIWVRFNRSEIRRSLALGLSVL